MCTRLGSPLLPLAVALFPCLTGCGGVVELGDRGELADGDQPGAEDAGPEDVGIEDTGPPKDTGSPEDAAQAEDGIGDGWTDSAPPLADGWRDDRPRQDLPRPADARPPEARAFLEVYVLDIWAQPLPASEATLEVVHAGRAVQGTGYPAVLLPLDAGAGDYQIRLSAPYHELLTPIVAYDGSERLDGAWLRRPAMPLLHGLSMSHDLRRMGNRSVAVHTVYLGLRHKWFSAQARPARRGNLVRLMIDGEEANATIAGDFQSARDTILASTWWWESDFELRRDPTNHMTLTPAQRWKNTVLGILEATPVTVRVLVGQFWGQDSILSWMTTDPQLAAYAETKNDGFEFMGQANATEGVFWFEVTPFVFSERVRERVTGLAGRSFDSEPMIPSTVPPHLVDLTDWPLGVEMELASYHQKFGVIDFDIAYVGGMNFRHTDWDTSRHLVFEPRRMLFDATTEERQAVARKEAFPDNGPRKDYVARLRGPAVADVADVFHLRWRQAIDDHVEYSRNSSDFVVGAAPAPIAGGLQAQVTATLPDPFWEHGIAETWFNAVAQAEDYILIEDQYFRVPMLVDAIIDRMTHVPGLRLLLITKPVNEWTDPGCEWTHYDYQRLHVAFPDRFQVLQLRAFDTRVTWGFDETEGNFADIDTHSKMLIVDDFFVSVGSANKNNRGIVYEGELNLAVLDAAFGRATRRSLLANILPPGTLPTDLLSEWWDDLWWAARWNDYVYDNWEAEGWDIDLDGAPLPDVYSPKGFVYSLAFGTVSACLIENVGPDMF